MTHEALGCGMIRTEFPQYGVPERKHAIARLHERASLQF
jgi:hypothetical protein